MSTWNDHNDAEKHLNQNYSYVSGFSILIAMSVRPVSLNHSREKIIAGNKFTEFLNKKLKQKKVCL